MLVLVHEELPFTFHSTAVFVLNFVKLDGLGLFPTLNVANYVHLRLSNDSCYHVCTAAMTVLETKVKSVKNSNEFVLIYLWQMLPVALESRCSHMELRSKL